MNEVQLSTKVRQNRKKRFIHSLSLPRERALPVTAGSGQRVGSTCVKLFRDPHQRCLRGYHIKEGHKSEAS